MAEGSGWEAECRDCGYETVLFDEDVSYTAGVLGQEAGYYPDYDCPECGEFRFELLEEPDDG